MAYVAGSTTVCMACYQSYFDTTENKCVAPTTAIANALSYSNPTTVSACATGYYVKANACTAVDTTASPNCNTGVLTGSTFICGGCTNGYSLVSTTVGSTVTVGCSLNTNSNCTVTNCQSCVSADTCNKCNDKYVLVGKACTSTTLTNCAMATNATTCSMCAPKHYIHNNACTLSAATVFGKILSLLLVFIL